MAQLLNNSFTDYQRIHVNFDTGKHIVRKHLNFKAGYSCTPNKGSF